MTDNWIITIIFAAGVVPFTLIGGWGEYGDYSIWPWPVGFATQAIVVLGFIAQRHGWWNSNRTMGA